MPHALWTGAVSFGLVTIPVTLHTAEDRHQLAFHMLDRRDLSPVKQRRVNGATGEEVPWDEIVKGYELEPGRWVVLADDDFRAADVEATQTIDILAFVDAAEVGAEYLDTPYWLQPSKAGRKAYALLRETLSRTGRAGVARIVLRTRQHLALLVPRGEALMLDLMRWPHEVRSAESLDLPSADAKKLGITKAELDMAETLVKAMSAEWDPSAYADTYHDDLLTLIRTKADTGQVAAPPPPQEEQERSAEVVDIMDLLKKSVGAAREA